MVVLAFLITFVHAHAFLMGQMMGMMARIMMTSAIYKKVCEFVSGACCGSF